MPIKKDVSGRGRRGYPKIVPNGDIEWMVVCSIGDVTMVYFFNVHLSYM